MLYTKQARNEKSINSRNQYSYLSASVSRITGTLGELLLMNIFTYCGLGFTNRRPGGRNDDDTVGAHADKQVFEAGVLAQSAGSCLHARSALLTVRGRLNCFSTSVTEKGAGRHSATIWLGG